LKITVLASGSAGNCTLIESGRTRLLVDCGIRPRPLVRKLLAAGVAPDTISGILLTHEHGDHVVGAIDFSERFGAPLFCSRGTAAGLDLDGTLFGHYIAVAGGRELRVGDVSVRAFSTPHDAAEPLAYRFEDGRAACVVVSDLGRCGPDLLEFVRNVQAMLFEFNHDEEMLREGPYPWSLKNRISGGYGHLSNRQSAETLAAAAWPGLRRVVAIHLSRQNNDPALVSAVVADTLRRADCGAAFGCAGQTEGYEAFEV
jgi:phosphoribosyl 1,2-cyclic phosphodiesterase